MADVTIHGVQATAEGVVLDDGDHVELHGERFRLASSIGMMPLMRFAQASKAGLGGDDMEGLAALYSLLRDTIDCTRPQVEVADPTTGEPTTVDGGPSEWDRFEAHATETKADAEELIGVVHRAIEVISARPTKRPGDSSAGPQTTSASSKAISSTTEPSPQPPRVHVPSDSPPGWPPPQGARVPDEVLEMRPVSSLLDRLTA